MGTFYFKTLGCKVNSYETEAMEELFIKAGYKKADMADESDVFVINTCTVTHVSDSKSRQMIRRAKRKNPDSIVCVVGCYCQVDPEAVSSIEGVDIIIGSKGRSRIVDLVEEFKDKGEKIISIPNLEENRGFDDLEIHTELDTTRAAIKIQEGCDMFCTYCIIPYARGHIASRSMDSIVKEAENLSRRGFKELVLTGIHVASYGKEPGGQGDLIDVVERVGQIEGIERIRLSSIEPRWVNMEKLQRLKATGKFCHHFHLSLQSGSDHILELMNRKYNTKIYFEKINLIRSVFPDVGLTTDVIVGFPGESDKDFHDSMDFCKKVGFSRMHIFPYSPRQGTPAALFDNQIDPQIKKERAEEFKKLELALRHDFMDSMEGKPCEVLVEEGDGSSPYLEGYAGNYVRMRLARDENIINTVLSGKFGKRVGDCVEFIGDGKI